MDSGVGLCRTCLVNVELLLSSRLITTTTRHITHANDATTTTTHTTATTIPTTTTRTASTPASTRPFRTGQETQVTTTTRRTMGKQENKEQAPVGGEPQGMLPPNGSGSYWHTPDNACRMWHTPDNACRMWWSLTRADPPASLKPTHLACRHTWESARLHTRSNPALPTSHTDICHTPMPDCTRPATTCGAPPSPSQQSGACHHLCWIISAHHLCAQPLPHLPHRHAWTQTGMPPRTAFPCPTHGAAADRRCSLSTIL